MDKLSAEDKGMSVQEVETRDRVLASWLTAERDLNDWLRVAYEAIKAESQVSAIDLMQQQYIANNAIAHRAIAAASKVSEAFLGSVQMWVGAGDYKSLEIAAEREIGEGRVDGALLAYHAMQAVGGERGSST